jgi:N-acetylmuramoyl-L-alanine amidase
MGRNDGMVKIYLDPGHGGSDPGAVGNGLKEKDLTLDICKRIESGLKSYENVEVFMSRETDTTVSLDTRTQKANLMNADVLLSVHINSAANVAAKGFESFIYPGSGSPTSALQNVMHTEIIRAMGTGIEDRGKKQANFHMLRESKMKAILTENLFIVNSGDAAKLADPAFRQKVADGHVNGLEKFLGLRKIERPPQPTKPQKLYYVQVGAFEDKENAEALAADLRKEGYRPYVKYE